MLTTLNLMVLCMAIAAVTPFACPDWQTYKNTYSKTYSTQEEDDLRQAAYQTTCSDLETRTVTYTVGVNELSDWTVDERRYLMNGVKQLSNPRGNKFSDYKTGSVRRRLASSDVNWRGDMTSVKKQGKNCASAWAFAITAMAEASVLLKQGESKDMSEQYLLECSSKSSCNGGYLEYALERTVNNGGIPDESTYPYSPGTTYSQICSSPATKTYVSEYMYTFYDLSDNQIITLLQNGPVAVRISAEGWIGYKTGVYECSENASTDHAVLLVGVTSTEWIAKNSWGTTWGQSGYIWITRERSKNCGIGKATMALSELLSRPLLLFALLVALLIVQ